MTDEITLDASAEENGLAAMLHGLLGENLAASDAKRRDFAQITTRFAVVAPDADVSVTLAFDGGRCTIYDGLRGDPEVVITADSGKIPELSLLQIRYGMPWVLDEAGKGFLRALAKREIVIRGLVELPIPNPLHTLKRAADLVRLTRVLSVNG
jgi:hypothetical protein